MIAYVGAAILVVLGLVALALQRFYSSVPAKELKRLAARGDHLAMALYRPVAHGESMRVLLWLLFGVSTASGILLTRRVPAGLEFGVLAVILALVVLTQSLQLTVRSARFAVRIAPVVNWMLHYVHGPFSFVAHHVNRYRGYSAHSGLFEKEDLLALLRQQREQPDNRISLHDLELVERVLQFSDRQAADVVLPMSGLRLVSRDDALGPVLLGELHNSGQQSFLVYDAKPTHLVGTLFLHDAVATKNGHVRDIMHPRLSFVHEDFSLHQVLRAFAHTGQLMVVVINSFEEPLGVITLQHLLVQLLGEQDEADEGQLVAYEDRAAIAAYKPAPQPVEAEGPAEAAEPDDDSPLENLSID